MSLGRQAAGILRRGLIDNIPALYYYRYRLFDPEHARRAVSFLHPEEMSMLHPTLALGRPADTPLRDKELFFEHGLRHGLPVVPAIAFFGDGALKRWHASPAARSARRQSRSEARRRWRRQRLPVVDLRRREEGLATRRPGARRTGVSRALRSMLGAASARVAATAANHPQLQALSGKGLSTLRIVTYRSVDGTWGRSSSAFACRRGSQPSTISTPAASPRRSTARWSAGQAIAKDPRPGPFARHPDSNAPIDGHVVPHFAEARALTLRAHGCFPWVPFWAGTSS